MFFGLQLERVMFFYRWRAELWNTAIQCSQSVGETGNVDSSTLCTVVCCAELSN